MASSSRQGNERRRKDNPGNISSHNFKDFYDEKTLDFVLEDVRLSTLQKKLGRETSNDTALALAFQISEALMYPDNSSYVRRSTTIICEAFFDVFSSGKHVDAVKEETAKGLAKVALILTGYQEFSKFYGKLKEVMAKSKKEILQAWIIKAMAELIAMKPNLKEQDLQELLADTMEHLERTENSNLLESCIAVMSNVSKWMPRMFAPHFQNVVDILVGWHIDSSQPPQLRAKISQILLSWQSFWVVDMEFSSGILLQFMEDLETYLEDVNDIGNNQKALFDLSQQILALIQVFNTVLSCMKSRQNAVTFLPPDSVVWCGTLLECVLTLEEKLFSEDILIAGQQSFLSLMERVENIFQQHKDQFQSFFAMNAKYFIQLSKCGQTTTMLFLRRTYQLLDSNHQSALVNHLLDKNSFTHAVIVAKNNKPLSEATMDFFRLLLNSKNISVVQEVYGHLVCLFEQALFNLVGIERQLKQNKFADQHFNSQECEDIVYFVLGCLLHLASGKSSVWAYSSDPSLFSFLFSLTGIWNQTFFINYPFVHHAVLQFNYNYCTKHAFFLINSDLLNAAPTWMSPSAEYFLKIMKSLSLGLQQNCLVAPSKKLLLTWVQKVFANIGELEKKILIFQNEEYKLLLQSVVSFVKSNQHQKSILTDGIQLIKEAAKELANVVEGDSIESIRSFGQSLASSEFEDIAKVASEILLSLPVSTSDSLEMDTAVTRSLKMTILKSTIPITAENFKVFTKSLLSEESPENKKRLREHLMQTILFQRGKHSWFLNHQDHSELKRFWICTAISQFCINHKLRTPFGKPQDTLTSIEKELRKCLMSKSFNSRRCKDILLLIEILEKHLRNAYDGSATILRPPTKNVAIFFQANKKTCTTWMLRIRAALIEVAFKLGKYADVVWHSSQFLPLMKETDDKEKIAVLFATSLTRLKMPEMVMGLEYWCAENTVDSYEYMSPLVAFSRGEIETGLKQLVEKNPEILRRFSDSTILQRELIRGSSQTSGIQMYEKDMISLREADVEVIIQADYLEALGQFHDGTIPAAWKDHNLPVTSELADLSDSLMASTSLSMLQSVACFLQSYSTLPSWSDTEGLRRNLKSSSENVLKLFLNPDLTPDCKQEVAILNFVTEKLQMLAHNNINGMDQIMNYVKEDTNLGNMILVKKWGDFFARYCKNNPHLIFQLGSLNLDIAKRARKSGNFSLSDKFLQKALLEGSLSPSMSLAKFLESMDFKAMSQSIDKASCLRQCAKLIFLQGKKFTAISTACGIASSVMTLSVQDNTELHEISARCCFNLHKWLQNDPKLLDQVYPDMPSSYASTSISGLLEIESNISSDHLGPLYSNEAITDGEMVIGRLLRLSVVQSPFLAKLWNALAEWALNQGEKVLKECEKGRLFISEDEMTEMKSYLPSVDPSHLDTIFQMMHWSELSYADMKEIESTREEFIMAKLKDMDSLKEKISEDGYALIQSMWMSVQDRIFFYHTLAVQSFFRFVELSTCQNEDRLISATLYLLQVTVKHALELQEVLQIGLETTPSDKWKAIVPQLFSRLNHPIRAVRNRISDLLIRLATDFPHLIMYPAVVGSASKSEGITKITTSLKEEQEKCEEKEVVQEDDNIEEYKLQNAYEQIVQCLQRKDSEKVEQVQLFVAELQRVSLLWDELWLGTLHQYVGEIHKRMRRMQEELKRLNKNKSLTSDNKALLGLDKYNIIFKPLLFVLDKTYKITNKPAETPHEKWFVETYGDKIGELMRELRQPRDPSKTLEGWQRLLDFQSVLGNKSLSKTSLKFENISPTLYHQSKTNIPMPGINSESDLVIASIENNITILLTKTKPKRVVFSGNDGKKYMFLFKGLEDLHLDERIMQFLSIANIMMKKSGKHFHARHYAVIPLGPRSGLIQWVSRSIPMFSLFKKWQMRQQFSNNDKGGGNACKNGIAFQKPSDMFYNKIYPKLRDLGIHDMENRKAWPLPIVRKVMQEMIEETPDNIMSQEFYFASSSANEWLQKVSNLTVSFAVMSVIGYVIGLGDRHLDNLLLDLYNGEVIHIDYNVCFWKGQQLRIPERVPCRLTQNVRSCFGFSGTGPIGLFKESCKTTLEVLRKGQETLMTLLEAFVYDPLVDWTPGIELGIAGAYQGGRHNNEAGADQQNKRDMQAEITFAMLGVRIAEMKSPWLENKVEVVNLLIEMEEKLAEWFDLDSNIKKSQENLSTVYNAMSVLKEAEANSNHKLYVSVDRFMEDQLAEQSVTISQEKLQMFLQENEKFLHLYQRCFYNLTTNQMTTWMTDLTSVDEEAKSSASDEVRAFLEQAGQMALLKQFEASEKLFCGGLGKVRQNLVACIQLLGHYSNVTSLYPSSHRSKHRNNLYVEWCNKLLTEFSVSKCQEVITEFSKELIENTEEKEMLRLHVLNLNFQMENCTQDINSELQQVFHHLMEIKMTTMTSATFKLEIGKAKTELHSYLTAQPSEVKIHLFKYTVEALVHSYDAVLKLEDYAFQFKAMNVNHQQNGGGEGTDQVLDALRVECSTSMNILALVKEMNLQSVNQLESGVAQYHDVLEQLQNLESSFFNIILNEGLKTFQREDPSAISLAIQLAEITENSTLDDVLQGLEMVIVFPDIVDKNPEQMLLVSEIKEKYVDIINCVGREASNKDKPGQMLLLALDSLFKNVDGKVKKLKQTVRQLKENPSPHWNTLSDAGKIEQMLLSSTREEETIDTFMFMQRIKIVRDFFAFCTKSLLCFKADPSTFGQTFPTGLEGGKPLKMFIVETYNKQLLGMGSFVLASFVLAEIEVAFPKLPVELGKCELEHLCNAFVERHQTIPGRDRSQFLKLELANILQLYRKLAKCSQLEGKVDMLHTCQNINQLQRNSFQWFHDNILPVETVARIPPLKSAFLADLQNYVSVIIVLHDDMMAYQKKYQELQATVEQRLKWACGANPELQTVFNNFSSCTSREIETCKQLVATCKNIVGSANTVLHHESLCSQSKESIEADSTFMALLGDCQQSASLRESLSHNLSKQELELFLLNPPKDQIDAAWIKSTEKVISNRVKSGQAQLLEEKEKLKEVLRSINNANKQLKQHLGGHQKLMSDVGSLLRSIAKSEDFEIPPLQNYLLAYREFSDNMGSLIAKSSLTSIEFEDCEELTKTIALLKKIIPNIYETVFEFSEILKEENVETFKVKKEEEQQDEEEDLSVPRVSEQKNTFALNVLRRVRHKLDGREPDALKRASAEEQVDFIIEEATNIDNLALMYEGWSAWI